MGSFAERILGGSRSFNFLRSTYRPAGRYYVTAEPADTIENDTGSGSAAGDSVYVPFDVSLFSGVSVGSGVGAPKGSATTPLEGGTGTLPPGSTYLWQGAPGAKWNVTASWSPVFTCE